MCFVIELLTINITAYIVVFCYHTKLFCDVMVHICQANSTVLI